MNGTLDRRSLLARAGLGAALFLTDRGPLGSLSAAPARGADPGGVLRLSSNENPYGPSDAARQAILSALGQSNRYADSKPLEEAIARREGLTPEHVVVGPGSQALLCAAGLAYGLPDGEIVTAEPSYRGLTSYAEEVGARVVRVPLDAGFGLDLSAMEAAVSPRTRLVYVCNPNNPTGTLLTTARLAAFCEETSRKAVVFVDEAYRDYVVSPGFSSMTSLVRRGGNVVVSHTFSKLHGLAGLRVGYLLAKPEIAARLRKLLMGGGYAALNALGLAAALASYEDRAFQETCRRRNAEERARATTALRARGLSPAASEANFLYFVPPVAPVALGKALEERGARIAARRELPGCRLTIGTPSEMARFFERLDEALRELPKTA